ncbi:uncharacterized protein LOC62_03G003653 [Vanrija pseudolonga]|uniref:Uncharacterized protein n=1 Tax=Vanrija pseudolonga TaxID=143232 RepID=A0AAF1BGS1_9TREE|nr:hypothetical protein LOC62_03G003653 [Vanrija pseudolonga]
MTAGIDVGSYPHLLDLILAYAPTDTLLGWRATCRAVREKADALLFRHIILGVTQEGYTPLSLSGHRLPLPPGSDTDTPLAHTTTIDAGTDAVLRTQLEPDPSVLPTLSHTLPNLRTVRVNGTTRLPDHAAPTINPWPLTLHCLVLFPHAEPVARSSWETHEFRDWVGADSVARIVEHYRFGEGEIWAGRRLFMRHKWGREETVIMVSSEEATTDWSAPALAVLKELAYRARSAITRTTDGSLTVVDLNAPSGSTDAVIDQVLAEVEDAVQNHLWRSSRPRPNTFAPIVRAKLRLLSREQYISQVGMAQFLLETTEE